MIKIIEKLILNVVPFCLLLLLSILCNSASAFQKASIPSAIFYEDDKVVLYYPHADQGDIAYRGFPGPFIMLHKKAGQNTELYSIKRIEEKTRDGRQFTHDVLDIEAELIWIKKMIIDQLDPRYPKIQRLTVHHYIESAELVEPPSEHYFTAKEQVIQKHLEKVLGKKHSVKGLPISIHSYYLQRNKTDLTLASSWRAGVEPNCNHTVWLNCAKVTDNTFAKAKARLRGRPYEKTVASRKAAAAQVAAENGWNSSYDIAMHGYKKIYPVISHEEVDFYIVIDGEKNDNRTQLVVIHDIGRDDYIVDMDILVGRTSGGNPHLGYINTGSFYNRINKIITPIVKRINPKSTGISFYHHVKNAVYPKVLRDQIVGQINNEADPAVFHSYGSWKAPNNNPVKNNVASTFTYYFPRNLGFDRHSFNAKLNYLQDILNNKKNGGNGLTHEYYYAEEKEVLRLATSQMIERRKKYAYLTDGYWAFQEMAMGQHIINGLFQNVEDGIDFRTMYSAYVQAFHTKCKTYIKDPVPYTHTTTKRTTDTLGNVHDELQDSHVTFVEKIFSEKFKEYFDASKRDLLGDVFDIVKSTKTRGKLNSPRMNRKLNIIDTVYFFVNEEQCDSVTMRLFADNLLRKANGDDPIVR